MIGTLLFFFFRLSDNERKDSPWLRFWINKKNHYSQSTDYSFVKNIIQNPQSNKRKQQKKGLFFNFFFLNLNLFIGLVFDREERSKEALAKIQEATTAMLRALTSDGDDDNEPEKNTKNFVKVIMLLSH